MRIAFDAYWWVEGPTSLQHVLRETVLAWRREFPDDELALVVRRRHLAAAAADAPAGVLLAPTRVRPQALLASRAVERVRRRHGFDAVVVQNFAARSRGVSAVYLHDVLFETNPEWFTPKERAYFSFMTRWVRRADIVFTSSATEANRIRRHTRARTVVPVGLGLSRELVDSAELEPVAGLQPERFLLAVGRLNVRKNLAHTIAGALASGEVTAEQPLVLVGAGAGADLRPDERIQAGIESGAVRLPGHVSDAQLRWLYTHTRLLLFLSLGEGFGMPPVEARAFGASVLASDLPVLRENLGDEATYVDPLDEAAIARAVRDRLAGPDEGTAESTVVRRHDWGATVRAMRAELAARLPGV
jgi:glycosyltransferase involved in cell wall biosynthesis